MRRRTGNAKIMPYITAEVFIMFDICCAGIATWDTLFSGVPSDLLSIDGDTAKGYHEGPGGDAVNASVSLARLGLRTAVCVCTGYDSAADSLEAVLKKEGVNTEGLFRNKSCHTASPVILIDEAGDRHILRVPHNGNTFFTADMIPAHILGNSRHLHIASVNMIPGLDGKPLADLFAEAHSLGMTTSMDASVDRQGEWISKVRDALMNCDIFIPSIQEARAYAGTDDIAGITDFFRQFPLKYFGIKLGAQGLYLTDFSSEYRIPSLYKGIPADTTGAGDALFAGFLAAWLRGYDLYSCGLMGSAQAASVMRQIGACAGAGTWADAVQMIEKAGGKLLPAVK